MKAIRLLFLVLLGVSVACQQEEEPQNHVEGQDLTLNWKTASPKEVFGASENGFNIPKEALEQALKLPEVSTVLFILEVENKQLQVRVAGANPNGDITKGTLATPVSLQKVMNKLVAEKSKRFETTALSKSVAPHILQPDKAADFISGWQQKWKNNTLIDAIGYSDERIRYFSMPVAVIEHMLQSEEKGVNLVWGVNPKGKFTTVFLPELDTKKHLLTKGKFIYDESVPCPQMCPI